MLSPEDQQRLDSIERRMHAEDPLFTRRFDLAAARRRHQRVAEARLFLLVTACAFILSTGVATMLFDPVIGWLIAGLGCLALISVVCATRRNPTRPDAVSIDTC